ncbi:hypothetical protein AHMF7605_03335 [Adhaeribacter arboris]|uniref:Uncharacterized protein n=1 Tax=Adhaeribacter arboris TaxID=2072846 RepID=A0A2T2YAU3_9BACT|nr:hypothetical protein AHMF7605_03335 [Adhaeribacter arboris]
MQFTISYRIAFQILIKLLFLRRSLSYRISNALKISDDSIGSPKAYLVDPARETEKEERKVSLMETARA